MRSKRGNLRLVVPGVLTLIIAGFVLIMGLIMLDELYMETPNTSTNTHNETLTTVTEAGETVSNSTLCGFRMSNVHVYNYTLGTELTDANYTYNLRSGLVQFTGASTEYNNSNWLINYTATFSYGEACEGANSTLYGMGKMGDYVDLIVLAIVISVIISLVIIGFAARRIR